MLKIYLIRHGKTYGNTLGRYIGRTDEGLCETGIEMLRQRTYPKAETVYASPLKRCIETAELIYPRLGIQVIGELSECDFGEFENKNYQELDGNSDYQKWVDSNGVLPFPGGESQSQFRNRCINGFQKVVEECCKSQLSTAAVVAHGGTIMAILEKYAVPQQEFYYWQADNAGGYELELDAGQWLDGIQQITVLSKLTIVED